MKSKKSFIKLVSLSLAATMLVGNLSVVSAHELKETTNSSLLRGALCPDCNSEQMVMRYTSWSNVGSISRKCIHHPKGSDIFCQFVRNIYWECPNCSLIQMGPTETRLELVACHGYQ